MNSDTQSNELPKPRTGQEKEYDEKVKELLKTYDHHKPAMLDRKTIAYTALSTTC